MSESSAVSENERAYKADSELCENELDVELLGPAAGCRMTGIQVLEFAVMTTIASVRWAVRTIRCKREKKI